MGERTRHDPDFRNEGLHKKKWAGVLEEEEEEEAEHGHGLVPEYDPRRGGIRLKLYSRGGGNGHVNAETHFFAANGGSLGAGAFSAGGAWRFPSSGRTNASASVRLRARANS